MPKKRKRLTIQGCCGRMPPEDHVNGMVPPLREIVWNKAYFGETGCCTGPGFPVDAPGIVVPGAMALG